MSANSLTPKSRSPLASVIVDSYNYGDYVGAAIDSALAQTYPNLEIIVVDDGSKDRSCDVIRGYAGRVRTILKENGGQASAFNRGFEASCGEVILFLDADDVLLPTAVERAVEALGSPEVVKAHWPMLVIDEDGRETGRRIPPGQPDDGDMRELIVKAGPWAIHSPPTSGNAWSRAFLSRVLPMPEAEFRLCADAYLLALAGAMGLIRRIAEPQGLYRMHGANKHGGRPFFDQLQVVIPVYETVYCFLEKAFGEQGLPVRPEVWRQQSWHYQAFEAIRELRAIMPPGSEFILVDDNTFPDTLVPGCRQLPFLERDNEYWGPPADDASAIVELNRMRQGGAEFVVFGWLSFWWFKEYPQFREHLRATCHCILENERLVVFDLHRPPVREPPSAATGSGPVL